MSKISNFLWFDTEAEQAAQFYLSVFKNSKPGITVRYGEAGPGPAGSIMTVSFDLEGQTFVAINGGPHMKINAAISFVVNCSNQAEVDYHWTQLSAGGTEVQCGWLKDKFGVSWQVVPTRLMELLQDPEPRKADQVMRAMMKMIKIDIHALEQAYASI